MNYIMWTFTLGKKRGEQEGKKILLFRDILEYILDVGLSSAYLQNLNSAFK